MQTEKCQLDTPLALRFSARVMEVKAWKGSEAIRLDRSAFYAEAGGQLGDRGLLKEGANSIAVMDTQVDEHGQVWHLLAGPSPFSLNALVEGEVQFEHRRDMMSQHSGQHLLSAVFYKVLGAETLSSRLGSKLSTLDLPLKELTESQVDLIAQKTNALILENRPIRIHYPDQIALAAMGLRKQPTVTQGIRILEIEDYDHTPCGGTHCSTTGQIGPLQITGTERYKGGIRVKFLCGSRVLQRLSRQESRILNMGDLLGCGGEGIEEAIAKLQRQNKAVQAELGQLRAAAAQQRVENLWSQHPVTSQPTHIQIIDEAHDWELLKTIASKLVERPDVAVFAACRDKGSGDWRVVIDAAPKSQIVAGQWFRETGKDVGARGGGRPHHAEGKAPATVSHQELTRVLR